MHKDSRCAHQVWRRPVDGIEHILWMAVSADGVYAAVFNAGSADSSISISLSDLELDGEYEAVELWSGERRKASDTIAVSLAAHGAKAYLFRPCAVN